MAWFSSPLDDPGSHHCTGCSR